MRLIHVLPLRPVRGVLLALTCLLLSGCDTEINLAPEIEVKRDAEVDQRLTELESSASEHRERAEALQAELDRVEAEREEENIVVRSEDGFTFRLNENAALVLVVLILGLTICFVSWMKHRKSDPDEHEA